MMVMMLTSLRFRVWCVAGGDEHRCGVCMYVLCVVLCVQSFGVCDRRRGEEKRGEEDCERVGRRGSGWEREGLEHYLFAVGF